MSTRSIIVVHGEDLYAKNKVVRLYKHSDGYPTGALPVIQEALEFAQKHKYEPNKYSDGDKTPRINVSTMVGLLIGAGTSEYGMGVVPDMDVESLDEYEGEFKASHLGCQEDLEWIYVLDLKNSTLSIYGGGYTGEAPQKAFKKGVVDPKKYAKCLYPEYQQATINETEKLIRYIEAWGFKINPSKTKKSNVLKMRGAK